MPAPTPEQAVDFCISKCGCGYCPAITRGVGYPCLEFICTFCDYKSPDNCVFCKGE